MKEAQKHPWYREPWPWILLAIPALGIVGCIFTIYYALNDNPDHTVRIAHTKHGLVIEAPHK